MLILHCSDVHLGRRPVGGVGEYSQIRFEDYFNSFEKTVDFAINNGIEVFMIAGDLFDKRELSPDILHRAENILVKLKNHGIRTIITEGNHDNISQGSEKDSWLIYLENRNLLERPHYKFDNNEYKYSPIDINNCRFYALGYPGSFCGETLEAFSQSIDITDGFTTILLVHTAIAGDDKVAGTVESDFIKKLKGKVDYIAGGHLHSYKAYPADEPYFFLPGSLEYFDLGEIGQTKGFIVYDTNTKKHEHFPAECRKALKIKINATVDSFDQFKTIFINQLDNHLIESGMLVYCEIILNKSIFIDAAWCEAELGTRGALRSSVKVNLPNINFSNIESSSLSAEQIEKQIIDSWEYFSEDSDATVASLQRLKTLQKESQSELFFEEFDHLLDSILSAKSGEIDEN